MANKNFTSTKQIKVSEKIADQVIGQDEAVEVIKKAAEQRRHVLLIGEPGTGKCVGQDTEIITESGHIKSKELFNQLRTGSIEIKKGDGTYILPTKNISAFSINKSGKIVKNKILKAYKGKRKKGIKILTQSGAEFTVSGEHPILTIKKGKMLFLPSDEINESSYIALARKIPKQDSDNLININKLRSPNTIIKNNTIQFIGKNGIRSLKLTVPSLIDNDLAYYLGICVGEARWQGNLIIYNNNKIIKEHIIKTLKEKFNYPAEYIINFENGIFLKKSRTLAHIMEKVFDFPLNPTKQSYHKIIPKQIFNTSQEVTFEFISGLVDADGYIGKRGFEITSSSNDLIEGLRILLLKHKILCRKSGSFKCATNTKLKRKDLYHRLSISDSVNLKKLYDCLKLKVKYKKKDFLYFKNKKPNTNVDIIPTIGGKIYELKNKSGLTYNQLGQCHATFHKFRYGKRNISRNLANSIIKSIKEHMVQSGTELILQTSLEEQIDELETITKSDIFWDKIKSMELVEDDMYDFEIENTHNMMISSGVIVHNSMLGFALAELLPKEKLVDILSFYNPNDENQPLIREVPAGKGREFVTKSRLQSMNMFKGQNLIIFILVIIAMIAPWWVRSYYKSDIMFAAFFMGGMIFLAAFIIFLNFGKRLNQNQKSTAPKLIVDNYKKKKAPFNDATGAHAGALLGDCLHDPFQSLKGSNKVTIIDDKNVKKNVTASKLINTLFTKHPQKILKKKQRNYEAIFLNKNELFVFGENNGSISPVEVLSSNRYGYKGKMIKLTTSENKELIVTPKHKIAIDKNRKIDYIEAEKLNKGDKIISKADDIIIDGQDIINTYDERQEKSKNMKLIKQKIKKIETIDYKGKLYNLTTSSGNVIVNGILCKNSGGLGTPAHERIVAGMIHKSHMGVLFIDEIATLQPATQQELLTALQEGKFAITGQSERSAGAMVRTEPVPCSFILVAAGNLETIKHMHPALRSRIRGYGYEIYMNDTMKDNPKNRMKIAKFVAQEVKKDEKIPHFNKAAVEEIIEEARKRANRKAHLTLRLRELGGLIRAAGDIAVEQKAKLVDKKHVIESKKIARTLEKQLADKYIERKKEYEVIITRGKRIGRVNGLAVIGAEDVHSGIILPIESEITPGGKESEIIATGKLGEIAKEAVKNVSAIVKRYFGEDIKEKYDIYVQFLQTYEGVEGDSASIAVATSIISALKKIPVKQEIAMTGSLSVRGEVLPIGGVSAKIEAAIETGINKVIVPKSNMNDIVLSKDKLKKIKIIPVETIEQVLKEALDWKGKQNILKKISKK